MTRLAFAVQVTSCRCTRVKVIHLEHIEVLSFVTKMVPSETRWAPASEVCTCGVTRESADQFQPRLTPTLARIRKPYNFAAALRIRSLLHQTLSLLTEKNRGTDCWIRRKRNMIGNNPDKSDFSNLMHCSTCCESMYGANARKTRLQFVSPAWVSSLEHMVLDGVLKEKKRSGCEPQIEHKYSIAAGDLAKIMSYFENVLESGDAVKLAQYCWFNLSLHFALRGAEVQLKLSKSDIVFGVESDGKEYASISRDFLSKNCQGWVQGHEFQTCGRLQEPRQVAALRKLLGKFHPQVERLFQRALQGHQPETKETWFMRSPLGHTIIRDMLPRLCKAASVERRYTNHCMRATSIYALKKAGFEDRVMCELTRHKNPKSLESYCRATEEEKRSMASVLDGGSAPPSSRPEPGTSKSHTRRCQHQTRPRAQQKPRTVHSSLQEATPSSTTWRSTLNKNLDNLFLFDVDLLFHCWSLLFLKKKGELIITR